MRRMPTEVATIDRARWLAEVADALERAQRLTWRIGAPGGNGEAMELYGRIEAARAEAWSLRLGGFRIARQEYDPNWMNLFPWGRSEES